MNEHDHDNNHDPFEDELRARLPLPAVSQNLLDRLERRAHWQAPSRALPRLLISLIIAGLVAVVGWFALRGPTAESPRVTPAPSVLLKTPFPEPAPIHEPSTLPIAMAPMEDDEMLNGLGFYSVHLAKAEPLFHYGLDLMPRSLTPEEPL